MSAGFFAVFDDIATLLDDAAAMSKVATKKTATILSDDLAVNAQKASGFASSRELPVLWAITKGSFRNKAIILPLAFILSAFVPWLIVPILILGGIYLAYEGAEKIYEYFVPHQEHHEASQERTHEEILLLEKQKIRSAILTDFILSIEIVIIALETVVEKALPVQIMVVTLVALLATIGVYGVVALLVRMDDIGFKLIEFAGETQKTLKFFGELLVTALPKVVKLLTIVGTLAMLFVAGGIFMHNLHITLHWTTFLPAFANEILLGLLIGSIALIIQKLFTSIVSRNKPKP